MQRLARVCYSYNPTNSDELKLIAGELVEVLGKVEEGWWRGKINGREGVFPSNFVELTTDASPSLPTANWSINQANGKLRSKGVINNTNIIDDNYNIGLRSQMDSQQQQQHDDDNSSPGERKPKPVRGVGFGDIFAGGKPKLSPVDIVTGGGGGGGHNNNNSQHKQAAIPKKLPPPAPMSEQSNSDSSSEAAPVLPPKPTSAQLTNQLGSHTPLAPFHIKTHQSPNVREQARVLYAYDAQNSDELSIVEGDIINVLEKHIADQGWWQGELNGQIGVFPDNFVELIKDQGYTPDILPHRMQKPTRPPPVALIGGSGSISMIMPTDKNQSITSNVKGFSKDLETNSDKSSIGSSASFLSLNRNKFGGSSSSGKPPVATKTPMNVTPTSVQSMIKTETIQDNRDHSRDSSTLGLGHRNHVNNNTSESFINYDSNSSHMPGKLNHLTAQRAKGPSSRRPPSNILAARDNISDNSLDIHHNGDIKDMGDHIKSSNINQSSTVSPPSNNQQTAINANINFQQITNKSPVTPPNHLKSADSNQEHSLTKNQKSPQQPKETTPTTPHWMVELKEKTTKKAHSDKPDKKRDSTIEDSNVISNNNFSTNQIAKQVDSPISSNVAPVRSSPPSNNSNQSYQQTPTSSLTGGVKNLTSRYSGDFTTSDKGFTMTPTQSISTDINTVGTNEFPQGATFKQQQSINNHGLQSKSNNINRPNFTPSGVISSRHEDAEVQRSPPSEILSHSTANNHNVPISNSISSTSPSYSNYILNSQANSNQAQIANSTNYAAVRMQNSSQNQGANKLINKNSSPSDSSSATNDLHVNSTLYDISQQQQQQQQQIVSNISEIEKLKEEITRLRDETRDGPTKSQFNSLENQVKDLKLLIENQKSAHGRLIKDLINDLADERKKTATMQIEIDRLQKLTSAV